MGQVHPQVRSGRVGSGRVVWVTLGDDTECHAINNAIVKLMLTSRLHLCSRLAVHCAYTTDHNLIESKLSTVLSYFLCKLNIHERSSFVNSQ